MSNDEPPRREPIVLIHGLWMTPRSWEHWIERYQHRGHRMIAPAYPGLEVEVEALREDPTPIEGVTVPDTLAHLETIIGELDEPPILIGHSYGGTAFLRLAVRPAPIRSTNVLTRLPPALVALEDLVNER